VNEMTFSEFARHIDRSPARVTALRKAGRLVLTANGKVDVDASLWKMSQTEGGAAPPPVDAGNQRWMHPAHDYQAARARREDANADLAEMESATRAGQLMETALVLAAIADAGATMRSHLATLPAILAPQIAALSDENLVRLLLEDHIEQALGELAEKFAGMAT